MTGIEALKWLLVLALSVVAVIATVVGIDGASGEFGTTLEMADSADADSSGPDPTSAWIADATVLPRYLEPQSPGGICGIERPTTTSVELIRFAPKRPPPAPCG